MVLKSLKLSFSNNIVVYKHCAVHRLKQSMVQCTHMCTMSMCLQELICTEWIFYYSGYMLHLKWWYIIHVIA